MTKRFQQSDFWCDFKCAHGWTRISQDGTNVLCRSFRKSFINFSIAYAPLAPEKTGSESLEDYFLRLKNLTLSLRPLLPERTVCVRYDPPLDFATCGERDSFVAEIPLLARKTGLRILKSGVDIQPPDSTYLDLSKSEDELLASMKSKWRYNVRYAAKHGVEVRQVLAGSAGFDAGLDSFYELYKTTARRDGIGIHPKSYYRSLLELGGRTEGARTALYIAGHEGEDLAAIITLFTADEAVYLYGCSGNSKRNLMPAYLAQWTAIRDAKSYGSRVYDFYGIPPADDENHPMRGLFLFKTGFGGELTHRPGSLDVPLSPAYRLYAAAERARAFWHKKILKKIRGR